MKLDPMCIKPAEYTRNIYQVTTPAPFDEIVKPEFWSHVSFKLRNDDRIEVIPEDKSYFAELIVLSAARQWAKVAVLRFVELESKPTTLTESDYEFKHRGPRKWSVIRKADKVIMKEGLDTREQAEEWLNTPAAA